jgi:hypothetical protein
MFDGNQSISIPWESDVIVDGIVCERSSIENIIVVFVHRKNNCVPTVQITFSLETYILGIFPGKLRIIIEANGEYIRECPFEHHISP